MNKENRHQLARELAQLALRSQDWNAERASAWFEGGCLPRAIDHLRMVNGDNSVKAMDMILRLNAAVGEAERPTKPLVLLDPDAGEP